MNLSRITTPPNEGNWLDTIKSWPMKKKRKLLNSLSDQQAHLLRNDWLYNARAGQYHPTGDWDTWFILAGRGFGKTRSGAEWVLDGILSGQAQRIALVGPTYNDVKKTMIEGESGLVARAEARKIKIDYNISDQEIKFPDYNSLCVGFTAEKPERLRGPQFHWAWCDELAAWRLDVDTWDMLQYCVRLGNDNRVLVTTTPKPRKLVKDILKEKTTVITGGSTFDNSKNLSSKFTKKMKEKYEGTRLGRQELEAEILDDTAGALWTRKGLDQQTIKESPEYFQRIVVAIDPSVTSTEDSDECGLVVAAIDREGKGYLLDDASDTLPPLEWCKLAVSLYKKWNADLIVGEVNNGGDLIESLLRSVDKNIPYKKVHATRGKVIRAEPVANLYTQGKCFHLGSFPTLEDQLCTWTPNDEKSPDRLDALVWAFTELMIDSMDVPKLEGINFKALAEKSYRKNPFAL